jgi:hypothetical protein
VAVLTACAASCETAEDTDEHHHEDPAEEACEHAQSGPFVDVAGTADAASGPNIGIEHTAFRVTLPADGSDFVGYVSFAAVTAGELAVYLSRDVPYEVVDGSDNVVSSRSFASTSPCSELAGAMTLDVPIGTVFIRFGPTTTADLLVVAELGAHSD